MIDDWIKKARPLTCGAFRGFRAHDGRFDENCDGHTWLAFEEPDDVVLWCPFNDQVASYDGRAFALNEAAIGTASTYALDDYLIIHDSPRGFILSGGKGIVVLDWHRAFDKLREAPRIAVDEAVLPLYRKFMAPPRMPKVAVRRQPRKAAA